MTFESLKDRWLSLSVLEGKAFLEDEFDPIYVKYSEPHRYYHTIEHIKSCLGLFDLIKGELSSPGIVEMALWLHDVIYNPRKNNNEEMSSMFAKELLSRIGVSSTDSKSVSELIMATKHPFIPTNEEQQYIIDIDLAVLGSSPEKYDQYSEQIEMEYTHIPSFLYKRGRLKVLESFLKQNTIFNTEYFSSKYENMARNNLQREIGRLT